MKKILTFLLLTALCAGVLCSCGAGAEKILGTYAPGENIYYYSLSDAAFNETDTYTVEEKDGDTVLLHGYLGVSGEKVSAEVGELKKTTLRKSSFDKLFFQGEWESGFSAESIRKNNKGAWKAEAEKGETVYILLQKDGSLLLAGVKDKEGFDTCVYIRKISPVN